MSSTQSIYTSRTQVTNRPPPSAAHLDSNSAALQPKKEGYCYGYFKRSKTPNQVLVNDALEKEKIVQSDLRELSSRLQTEEADRIRLQRQVTFLESVVEDKEIVINKASQKYQEKISSLEAAHEHALKEQLNVYKHALDAAKQETAKLIAAKDSELTKVCSEVRTLQTNNAAVQREFQAYKDASIQQQAQINQLKQDLIDANADQKQSEASYQKIISQHETVISQSEATAQQLRGQVAQLTKAQQSVHAAAIAVVEADETLDDAQKKTQSAGATTVVKTFADLTATVGKDDRGN